MLTKCSKDTRNINLNTLYSQRVGKYNKIEFLNLQDLKETVEGFANKFQFKLGYVEEQLFVTVFVNFGSFMVVDV